MSSAPLDKLVANKTALMAVGLGGGLAAVFGGFFIMAFVTVAVLKSDAGAAGRGGGPDPGGSADSGGGRKGRPKLSGLERPDRVADDFALYLKSREWKKAYDMTVPDFPESAEAFQTRMERAKYIGGAQRYSTNLEPGADNTRVCTGDFERADGSVSFRMELVKGDDGWRVSKFTLNP